MNISAVEPVKNKCFKCEHLLYDSLNISYNATSCMVVLWNKFQVLVYEDNNLNNTAKVFLPDFQIQDLLLSNNYIICLDSNGNVHTISLKFKNAAQKRFKSNFPPKENNLLSIYLTDDHVLGLKYESNDYYLCLYKINAEFQLENAIRLIYSDHWPLQKPSSLGKCLLTSRKIIECDQELIKQVYKVNETKDCSIIVLSFDKLSVFTCLYNPKNNEEITLLKLHTCPSKICNIEINNEFKILIFLNTGTVMRFDLNDVNKTPEIVHLNKSIQKYVYYDETLIYTDGQSMWRTDKTFTDITFREFILVHVKDIAKYGDRLICTTYTNLTYNISIDDDKSYLKSLPTEEYCAAEKLLNNAEYLYKIMEEIEKNNDIVKKIKEESSYITALSLSNRQDIMDTIIQQNVIVYENYDEVVKDHTNIIHTDDKADYFDANSNLLLIQITTSLQHVFNNMLSKLFKNLIIHVTLISNEKLLKTVSVKLKETLNKLNVLVTIKNNIFEMDVHTNIIVSLPGCHNQKELLWACLYRKHVRLNSEHFIKGRKLSTHIFTKESEDSIDNLILKTSQHNELFKIDTANDKNIDWSFYLKLPANFKELLMDNYNTKDCFNPKKAQFLLEQYTSKEFLESKNDLQFEIGCEKVKIQVINDFSEPLLKVTSENISIAYNIRNFFSTLIYNDFKDPEGMACVKYTLYNIAENLQKELKTCLREPHSFEAFRTLADQFERGIIGALPM